MPQLELRLSAPGPLPHGLPLADVYPLRRLLLDVERLLLIQRKRKRGAVQLTHFQAGADGQLSLSIALGDEQHASLLNDLSRVQAGDALDSLPLARAKLLDSWQRQARSRKQPCQYHLALTGLGQPLAITGGSHYSFKEHFVQVERYLYGVITRMGGRNIARIQMRDEALGLRTIRCPKGLLAAEERNRLYKPVGMHVRARQNTLSGKIDQLEFLRFVDLKTRLGKAELLESLHTAAETLRSQPDRRLPQPLPPSAWLQQQRQQAHFAKAPSA